jgi:hypothetical protein
MPALGTVDLVLSVLYSVLLVVLIVLTYRSLTRGRN